MRINRNRVGRAFHRQAGEYDQHATVQKRVVERLMSLIQGQMSEDPAAVLDIGCGTGHLLSSLVRRYPHSRLYGLDLAYNMTRCAADRLGPHAALVNGDAEHLPFRDAAFDLLVSTSTLQWIDNLDLILRQGSRVLRPDGLMCIAFFGGRTMWELQECYRQAVGSRDYFKDRLHRFKDIATVRESLERSVFSSAMLFSETEMDYYPDVPELLRSVKRIGAGASAQDGGGGGLGWRRVLDETSRLYREKFGADGMIPVTYEVLYVVVRRPAELIPA